MTARADRIIVATNDLIETCITQAIGEEETEQEVIYAKFCVTLPPVLVVIPERVIVSLGCLVWVGASLLTLLMSNVVDVERHDSRSGVWSTCRP
jgi:hypothetical protein